MNRLKPFVVALLSLSLVISPASFITPTQAYSLELKGNEAQKNLTAKSQAQLSVAGKRPHSLEGANDSVKAHSKTSSELQAYISQTGSNEFVDVLIKLKDSQTDNQLKAEIMRSPEFAQAQQQGESAEVAERKVLIGNWEEQATKSQAAVLAFLKTKEQENQARNIKSFYIVNALKAELDPGLLEQLATFEQIERIDHNGKIRIDKPIKKKGRTKRSIPAEQDGIEPGLKSISVPQVWSEFGITGRGVRVGIIDGGTYYEHPSLVKKFEGYIAPDELYTKGYYFDAVEESQEQARPLPSYNHGTHVAGIILGEDGPMNRIGVAPGATFIAARALDEELGSTEDLLEAAQWMLKPGGRASNAPRIINNSWGGDADNNEWFKEIADKWRAANILPVFAAGNTTGAPAQDGSIANPGNLFNVFTVAATDIEGKLADFSKVGPSAFGSDKIKPDISAPGVEVRSALATGGYTALSGTSMAAPHVSGVAALLLEANPGLSVDELERILKESATPSSSSRFGSTPNFGMGYGIVNAYDAVRKALALKQNDTSDTRIKIQGHVLKAGSDESAPQIKSTTSDVAYKGRSLQLGATASDDVSVVSVKAYYADKLSVAPKVGDPLTDELKATLNSIDLKLSKGSASQGEYLTALPKDEFKDATKLFVWFEAQDVSGKKATTSAQIIPVKLGVTPDAYHNDFETSAEGWLFTAELGADKPVSDWSWGSPSASLEPKAPSPTKLIGTKLGSNGVTHIQDSYAYMPPIDLSNPELKQPKLSFEEYLGFNGVTTAKIQVAPSEEGPWEDMDEKLIPPGTQAAWHEVSYSLAPWVGSKEPIHVRFYFHSPDHGEGVGWYIDNVRLSSSDTQAPAALHGLKALARADKGGVQLYWQAASENDVVSYEVYRYAQAAQKGALLESLGEPKHLASVAKDAHLMAYFDLDAPATGASYVVRAKDAFGNESAAEEIISYKQGDLAQPIYLENFNEHDGSLKSVALRGSANDWEYGLIKPVGNENSTFVYREIMIGLRDKITLGDKVWGTNLGKTKEGLDLGVYDAQVQKSQHAALLLPSVTLPQTIDNKSLVLNFESFNALHYSSDYQENFEQVEISADKGQTWSVLLPAAQIMDTADKFKFVWKQADLSSYAGKEVQLRFVLQTTEKQVVNPYEIGWYIDNLMIGEAPVELKAQPLAADEPRLAAHATNFKGETLIAKGQDEAAVAHVFTAEPQAYGAAEVTSMKQDERSQFMDAPLPAGFIPLVGAQVELEELGREQRVHAATGAYSFLASTGAWKLSARAYGYRSQSITLTKDSGDLYHDFILEPLSSTRLSGVVRDNQGKPLAHAFVRVLDDANVAQVQTDEQGHYSFPEIFEGKHIVRAYKDQKSSQDVELTLEANVDAVQDFMLADEPLVAEEMAFDNGEPRLNLIFKQAGKGAAVRFYPKKKGGLLSSARAYFKQEEGVEDKRVKIAVMQDDENQRMIKRAEFIAEVQPDAWNEFDLRGYQIRTDKPFYIVVFQLNPQGLSYGVALDTQESNSEAADRSFLFNGTFIPAKSQYVVGAFMIRAQMSYPSDAQLNEKDPAEMGSEPEVAPSPVAEDSDFEWEMKEEGAVVKKYKGQLKELKVPATHEGKPVLEIGPSAFAWKYLRALELPDTITKIGEGAFSAAFNKSAEASLRLPKATVELEANAFNGSGLKELYAPGVQELKANVFNRSDGLVIHMPELRSLDLESFGSRAVDGFKYNQLYVDNTEGLQDIEGRVLINPARIHVKVYLREDEKLDMEKILYGPGDISGYENFNSPQDYYKIGQHVSVEPPRNVTISYYDKAQELTLVQADHELRFEGDKLKADIKPIYVGDAPVLEGKTLPGVRIRLISEPHEGTDPQEIVADEHGIFKTVLTAKAPGDRLELELVDSLGKSFKQSVEILESKNKLFIIEPNTTGRILDYLGPGGELSLPASVADKNETERQVRIFGPASLREKGINTLVGLENLELLKSIEVAAFYGNELESLSLPNNVKELGRAAFAHNKIHQLKLPRLLHKLGASAFEYNALESLSLGEYTGHFGAYCFAHNNLRAVEIPARTEEIDEGAFMANRLTRLEFARPSEVLSVSPLHALPLRSEYRDRSSLNLGLVGMHAHPSFTLGLEVEPSIRSFGSGHSHVLTELPAKAFADNNLREVVLPEMFAKLADDSFANNGRIVNILSGNRALRDSVLDSNSGHIINGAEVLLRFVDEEGERIAPDQSWVQQGSSERVGDPEKFYRIGKEITVSAPDIVGYELLEPSKSIIPQREGVNVLSFSYKKLEEKEDASAPHEGAEDGAVDPGYPADGSAADEGASANDDATSGLDQADGTQVSDLDASLGNSSKGDSANSNKVVERDFTANQALLDASEDSPEQGGASSFTKQAHYIPKTGDKTRHAPIVLVFSAGLLLLMVGSYLRRLKERHA